MIQRLFAEKVRMLMGYVKVKGIIGNPRRTIMKELDLLVDTGAFYTIIPPSLAKELNIEPSGKTELTLADKRVAEADIAIAYMKMLDRDGLLPVAIMESPLPLLGATALEGLGLKVDPSKGILEYSRPFGLAALEQST